MSTVHQGSNEEEKKNINNVQQPYQRVADRVQQWNRYNLAIPEAGYITLGTIRYGVRLSSDNNNYPHRSSSTKSFPLSSNNTISKSTSSSNISRNQSCSITPSRSGSSDRSTNSSNNHSCCCIGSSNIALPWTTNYARTKISAQSSNSAKNRILSTSQSSSFSLTAMSAPDPPSPPAADAISSPISTTLNLANRDLKIHKNNKNNNLTSNTNESSCQTITTTITTTTTTTTSATTANTESSISSPSSSTFQIVSKFNRQNLQSGNDIQTVTTPSLSTSSVLKSLPHCLLPAEIESPPIEITSATQSLSGVVVSSSPSSCTNNSISVSHSDQHRSCNSISYSTINCCKILNSSSSSSSSAVSVEQCRDRELSSISSSSIPKSSQSSSICCYTIASQSRTISKQLNRSNNNLKRIPRSIVQQHSFNPSSSKSSSTFSPSSLANKNSLSSSSSRKIPPPIPPRPHHTTSTTASTQLSPKSGEDDSVNPIHFHRKLQKFEQQCSNSNNSGNINQQHHGNCSGNRFEFFGCFSSNDQVSSSSDRSSDYCSSSNSEINYIPPNQSSSSLSGDNRVILRVKKFNNTKNLSNINKNNCGVNQSNNQQQKQQQQNAFSSVELSKRNLRSNNNSSLQDVISIDNNDNNIDHIRLTNDLIKVKSLDEVPKILSSSTTASTAASVVIRKLTPKLTRKSFKFGDHITRGDSEDRLINDQQQQHLNKNNQSKLLLNRIGVGCSGGNNSFDYDSDIGFIDSSGGDGDHSSSLSDIDPISIKNSNKLSSIQKIKNLKSIKVTSSSSLSVQNDVPSFIPIKNSKNYCNLSFDSVPKILNSINSDNNKNLNNNNNNYNIINNSNYTQYDNNNYENNNIKLIHNNTQNINQNLLIKDLYDSLTDIDETSTISCLSEDNICCCDCNNLNTSNSDKSLDNICNLKKSHTIGCFSERRNQDQEFYFGGSSGCSNYSDYNNYQQQQKINTTKKLREEKIYLETSLSPLPSLHPPPLSPNIGETGVGTIPTISTPTITEESIVGYVKGPVFKRIPAIESFGYIGKNQLHGRSQQDRELIMEKRRNTLDRLQRLGFGRRSSPSPTQQEQTKTRKSYEKSERLRELTELLKGNRKSPTPPPIPPPRKLRHANSLEKTIEHEPISSFSGNHSDDILPMDEEAEEDNIPDPVKRKSDEYSHLKNKKNDGTRSAEILTNTNNNHHQRSPSPFLNTLKPNTSISNLESIIMRKDKSKSPSPTPKPLQLRDDDLFSKLPRAESKTIIGSYTQKTIPFRSASFSQIDYSSTSGKYIKSALGAIRDKLRSNKESSVVDNTNLTLPRKKDDLRNQSTRKKSSLENYEIDKDNNRIGNNNSIKKTELSINLKFEQDNEKFSLEDIVNPPDVIFEEDYNSSEIDRHSINQIKDEDIFELDKSLINKSEIDSLDIIPQTVEEKKDDDIYDETFTMNLKNRIKSKMKMKNENLDEQQEASLAVLTEEDIPLESPPENFLQTATTCLIPVPVYECVAGEWNAENTSEQWLHMAPEEIGLNPEICVPLNSSTEIKNSSQNDSEVNKSNETVEQEKKNKQQQQKQQQQKDESELKDLPLLAIELLPTISVSQESLSMASLDEKQTEMNSSNTKKENTSISDTLTEKVTAVATASAGVAESKNIEDTNFKLSEYVEVKKRYSNDDMKVNERCQSTDSCVIRGSEEKRRIDKSRRRKGMYIQWPTIDKNVDLENSDWSETPGQTPGEFVGGRPTLDFTKVDFSKINQTLDSATEQIPFSASSRPSECKGTPGSLGSYDPLTPESDYNRPFWPKGSRRSSLSCQSSEEKDDSSPVVSYNQRSVRNAIFLRTDSTSDNESDRTRASPSPAPGEQDLRRYSKRPLRGPYGQMLEAEMKKPAKMYYDEILEELKTPESTPGSLSPPTRNYSTPSHSFDDNNSIQQQLQSKNGRNRRNNVAYLPIPIHTRAASTPSQMETPTTTTASIDGFSPHHKRYQSTSDTISHLSESPSTFRSKVADAKKFSLDSNRDRSPKRASSEVPDTKHQHAKRSSSTASEKQQKRSLDEMRLSQVSRTPSERSMGSAESGKHSGNLMPTPELLAELLKGSSERLISEQRQQIYADTRTHVVQEIFRNEQSYVDSLQTVVMKYLNVLKTPEYAGMIDSKTVDEIFFMVPEILNIHEKFLNELKARLDSWDSQQKVGDAFHETFSKTEVLETYTAFVNNCNRAKDAIKTTSQQRPSFGRFLEATAREHKGKLSLDNLLIKPVQKFPNYEMLFTRLIKHTDIDHPDQKPLQDVLKLVHDILVHINCKEKEVLENGQREATLRELEGIIEGITELVVPERQFLLFDLVSMPSGQGARKERGFFLFSDLLVITSIKRRSGTIRKPNTITCPGSVASTLDTNKYKFLTKVPLDSLEILKTKDENVRRIMNEIEQLADDCSKLQQIAEITSTLKYPHQLLEETIRDLQREVQRQLSERQSNDTQLNVLELTVNSTNGSQKLTIVFNKAEKRSQWEEGFNEAKQKLAASLERHPIPEFLMSIPIRKTRAGLQFTCAAPTLSSQKDVWVCNSDGYVGQVCVLSIAPEPNVTSCNGVCNARILCVASVPAAQIETKTTSRVSLSVDENSQQCHSPRSSNSSNCQASTTTTTTIGNLSAQGGSSVNISSDNGGSGNTENKKISNQSDNGSDIQFDSNSSSDDSEPESGNTTGAGSGESVGNQQKQQQQQQEERMPSPAPSSVLMNTSNITTATTTVIQHQHQDSNPIDETDNQQSTMWLGTEDGCIHVYNCTDNIRIKKNKIKIQHVSAVYSILYLDNRVFVALANGDICVYLRENGGWNTNSPLCISIGSVTSPVNKLINVHGKLWCSIQGIIKVLDTKTLQVENQIQISSDSKPITNMVVSNNYVWISIQNSAHIKCFHSKTHDLVFEVNLAPSVNKMLSNCDDIIRQHKAACLRVTSLLACKDLIWIGTSAGVLLTIPAQGYNNATGQNQSSNSSSSGGGGGGNINSNNMPVLTGIPHGHTGHVRFLAYVDTDDTTTDDSGNSGGDNQNSDTKNNRHSTHAKTKSETGNVLIISGGDGYEDFRCSGANTMSEIAGREDSTNHLLLWQM